MLLRAGRRNKMESHLEITQEDVNSFFEQKILHKHISRSYGDDYSSQISRIIAKAEKSKNYDMAIRWLASAISDSFLLDFNVHINKESLSQEEYLKKVDILLKKLRKEFASNFNHRAINSMMDF